MSDNYVVLTTEQQQELLAQVTAANAALIAIAAMVGPKTKQRKPRKARKAAEQAPTETVKRRGRPPKAAAAEVAAADKPL